MRPDIYKAIQKALYENGELIASKSSIEVIATVVADMAIREERERCAKIVERRGGCGECGGGPEVAREIRK